MSEQTNTPPTQAEITKQRKRFEATEEKLNRLLNAVSQFEEENGNIGNLSDWLKSMLENKTKIEQLVQTFSQKVSNEQEGLETKRKNLELQVASFHSELEKKTKEFEENLNKKIKETTNNLENKINKVDDVTEEKLEELDKLLEGAFNSKKSIDSIEASSSIQKQKISDTEQRIEGTLKDAEKALTSATAAGLAKEFEKRRKDLFNTQKWWVGGLVVSLILALLIAYCRFNAIQELLTKPNQATWTVIFLNLLISALSIAAPVWFAWVSTKQIGYCFRLSEDYGFKASIAAAYEGFRKEIEQLPQEDNSEMEDDLRTKLLDNILNTLDERPLRYVEHKVHGSPLHEIMPMFKNREQSQKES